MQADDDGMKAERVQEPIETIPGWEIVDEGKALRRTYRFPGFRASVAFVAYVAELAEVADHHPDIDIRYSKVTLTLTTHSEGGLTDKDFALARQIDGRGD